MNLLFPGYSEFEYAQAAIKYQVTEYLLKPLNDQKLSDALQSIKQKLEEEKEAVGSRELPDYPTMTGSVLFSQLLSSILDGNLTSTYSIYEELALRQLTFMERYGCIMHIAFDELTFMLSQKNPYDTTTYHLKLNRLCQDYAATHNLTTIYDHSGSILFLLTSDTPEQLQELARDCFQSLLELSKSAGYPKLVATCGLTVTDFMDLADSNMSASETLILTLKNMPSPIFYDHCQTETSFIKSLNTCCENCYQAFLSHSTDQLYISLTKYCSEIPQTPGIAAFLRFGSYLIHYICSRSNIKTHYIKAAYKELTKHADCMIPSDSLHRQEFVPILVKVMNALTSFEVPESNSESTQLAELAKQFILTHYQEQISLSLIAEHLGINNCYLSDLIHKYLGEPYTKYILRIRMEQAIRIMKESPNEKVYEIAEKTGFISAKHFITVFKKYYGMTPASYAEKRKFV